MSKIHSALAGLLRVGDERAHAKTADGTGRLAITLEPDGARENDMLKILYLRPHGAEEGTKGYRREARWYVGRNVVYDGTIRDGVDNLQLVEISENEDSAKRLLALLTGAVRVEMREAA
jgi:hypothetical protein